MSIYSFSICDLRGEITIGRKRLGDWEVSILQELADTDLKLGEIKYSVVEAGQ